MLETAIQIRIQKAIKEEFGRRSWGFKVHGSAFQPAGIPDLLYVIEGHQFALEVKRPGEEPTRIQEHTIARINAAGGHSVVVTSVDEAINYIRATLAETKRRSGVRAPGPYRGPLR